MEPLHLFDDSSQIEPHVGLVGACQPILEGLKEDNLFTHLIMDNRVIAKSKRCNAISAVSFRCHPMKELCVAVSKLEMSGSAVFHPVYLLTVQQVKKVLFQDKSEVSFWNRQLSPFL